MKKDETELKIYSCMSCGKMFDMDKITKMVRCNCGGFQFAQPETSKKNIFKFMITNPKWVGIWFKENVLGLC